MTKRFYIYVTVLGLLFGMTSKEAAAETVTRADIEHHLQAMVDLYNADPVDMNAIYKFVEDYTVEGGIYKSQIYINTADVPFVKSADREQTLRAAREMKDRYIAASARYEITDFKLIENEQKAQVKYKVWHTGTLEHKLDETKVGIVSFESLSDCFEVFSKDGAQIKGHENYCNVRMKQDEPTTHDKKEIPDQKAP